MDPLLALRDAIALATFIYAGFRDWKEREVDPRVWIPAMVAGGCINGYELWLRGVDPITFVSLVLTGLFVAVFAIAVFLFRAMGGADFLAIASMALLYPYPSTCLFSLTTSSPIPPVLSILSYAVLALIAIVIANLVANARRAHILDEMGIRGSKKLRFLLTARVMTVEELERKRFFYPIYVPGLIDRATFDVEEDDRAWIPKLRESGAKYVVATWGIPTVTLFAVALVLYVLLGRSIIDLAILASMSA